MSRVKKVDVLIAGAGPVGLATAIALARRGLKVEVFEKSFRTTTNSYALALHSPTVGILDELGVGQLALAAGRPIRGMAFYEGADRHAEIRFGVGDDAHPCLVLPQATLEKLLEEELSRLDVHVHWNHRVARVTPSSDGPAPVTVAKLGEETLGYAVSGAVGVVKKEIEYEAHVVLGLDGHKSVVRQNMFIDFPAVNDREIFAVMETELDHPFEAEARASFAGETTNLVWPMAENGCRFAFQLADTGEPIEPRFKSRQVFQLHDDFYREVPKERLGELIEERLPWFDGAVREVRWSGLIQFERRLAASFGKDNVYLAGDAAHLGSPVAGMSMNLGVHEGQELAAIAEDVVKNRGSLEGFEAYGRRRHAVWSRILGRESVVTPGPSCPPWVSAHAERIAHCVPASGDDFKNAVSPLGLEVTTIDPVTA